MKIPSSHPRAKSLKLREKIVWGIRLGITSLAGLVAHGRGEAFYYLLGEKTHSFAKKALRAAAAHLLCAKHPVISVNGNVAALVGKELALLSNRWNIPLEVNIFHHTKARERKLLQYLKRCGARQIFSSLNDPYRIIPKLAHARRKMSSYGIAKADVVFVPLEDGDRCQALMEMGKKVITIDLNPLSRTARRATVTIVDELTQAIQTLTRLLSRLGNKSTISLLQIIRLYDYGIILEAAERTLRRRVGIA